jgi:hypothetical protein
MSYIIVEFVDDKSVYVAPSVWLADDGMCEWPLYRALTVAVRKCESHNVNAWSQCKV